MSLHDMLDQTHELNCTVFQICDHPQLGSLPVSSLQDLHACARELGIQLEVGTRGVEPAHLAHYLDICQHLGATTLRTMLNTATHKPGNDLAVSLLKQSIPAFEAAGVSIALETYEQVSTPELIQVVDSVGSDTLGICLDPANCVAALELPHDVIDRTAAYVKNMHIKDFAFSRQAGWVGFTLAGTLLGEGLLDYDHMIAVVDPAARGINQIVEHWLPWQGDSETTCLAERQWTENSVKYLRSKQ